MQFIKLACCQAWGTWAWLFSLASFRWALKLMESLIWLSRSPVTSTLKEWSIDRNVVDSEQTYICIQTGKRTIDVRYCLSLFCSCLFFVMGSIMLIFFNVHCIHFCHCGWSTVVSGRSVQGTWQKIILIKFIQKVSLSYIAHFPLKINWKCCWICYIISLSSQTEKYHVRLWKPHAVSSPRRGRLKIGFWPQQAESTRLCTIAILISSKSDTYVTSSST